MAGFFGFFDFTKEGPGVPKDLPKKRGVALFFDTLGRKFGKLLSLNLLYLLTSIPALIVYFFAAGYVTSIVSKVQVIEEEFALGFLILNVILAFLFLVLLGSGPASAGLTYIVRNYSTETHAWLFSDFFEHFRKNFKQGMAVFGIDVVLLLIIITNLDFYTGEMSSMLPENLRIIMSTIVFVFVVIYFCMRMYLYPMMVTFDLKITQLYKNSFLFVMMKLPQTIGMFLLLLGACAGAVYLTVNNVFLGILLALLGLFSLTALMQIVYTYPAIMKVMAPEESEEKAGESAESN